MSLAKILQVIHIPAHHELLFSLDLQWVLQRVELGVLLFVMERVDHHLGCSAVIDSGKVGSCIPIRVMQIWKEVGLNNTIVSQKYHKIF